MNHSSISDTQVLKAKKYWGEQTSRALALTVSSYKQPIQHIVALAYIKKHTAQSNARHGLLDLALSEAIIVACDEIIAGVHNDQFNVDVFQTGSGTSWNMNMNEVIAHCASLQLSKDMRVHPNDHVNLGQSSNDVIPSALYIAARQQLTPLLDTIKELVRSFENLAVRYANDLKLGRTHLQDAVPLKIGQEFDAFAQQLNYSYSAIKLHLKDFEELPLGGTAVGSGLHASVIGIRDIIQGINDETGLHFKACRNPATRMAGGEVFAHCAGLLTVLCSSLIKISTDMRVLASGPHSGIGELILPTLQQGSSIMPGKTNPVVPELVLQASLSVIGKCHTISQAVQHGPLQLLMVFPLISYELLTSIDILSQVCRVFAAFCVTDLKVDTARAAQAIEQSLALITPLSRHIGYDKAAALAKKAQDKKISLREVLLQDGAFNADEIDQLLDPTTMVY